MTVTISVPRVSSIVSAASPVNYSGVSMATCGNCGRAVEESYYRLYADSDGVLHACGECGPGSLTPSAGRAGLE